jgi:hypothetical protein
MSAFERWEAKKKAEYTQWEAEKKAEIEKVKKDVEKWETKKTAAVQKWDANKRAETRNWEALKKAEWEAEREAMSKLQQFGPIVKLNIGSTRFETSRTTLCRFPDTMIGCMFSGRHTLLQGEDGHFFIDRDGTHFRHILNFLCSPEGYKVDLSAAEEQELRRECVYYGIDQLMFPKPKPPRTDIPVPKKDFRNTQFRYVPEVRSYPYNSGDFGDY